MSKIGTSAARNEVNTLLDEIWRISCHKEKVKARQWERDFDYLVPAHHKKLSEQADDQINDERIWKPNSTEREVRSNGRKLVSSRPSSIVGDPHFSELTLVPEPPQRVGLRAKYYMKQEIGRHNSNSRMLKYYNQTLPPNKIKPSETKDPREMTQQEIDESLRRTFTLNPYDTFERKDLYQHESTKSTRGGSSQNSVRGRTDTMTPNDEKERTASHVEKHAQDMIKTQFRKESPRTRYGNEKKITSHDYGWLPSLEFPGRSVHGVKQMRFD